MTHTKNLLWQSWNSSSGEILDDVFEAVVMEGEEDDEDRGKVQFGTILSQESCLKMIVGITKITLMKLMGQPER
jgi:hypothetical protein